MVVAWRFMVDLLIGLRVPVARYPCLMVLTLRLGRIFHHALEITSPSSMCRLEAYDEEGLSGRYAVGDRLLHSQIHGAKLPGKRKQRGGNVASPVNPNGRWRFGVYEVDAHNGEVRRGGTLIKLREQSFCILVHLLEHPGELVTREDLRRALWPSDTLLISTTA